MTDFKGPTRFDPRNIFLGKGWNVFMLIVGSIALWGSLARLAIAYHAPGWLADSIWAFIVLVLVHTLWTSASRLWRARQSSRSTDPDQNKNA